MKQLPILYARGENDKILEWQVEIDGAKFRMITGAQGCQHTTSDWTTCSGKNTGRANETTPAEQAESESKAKWEKKLKTGYTTDKTKVDECVSYIEPMLAKNLKDRLDKINWKKGVLVQNKFNGHRCVATKSGASVVLRTRKGETYISCVHINKDLEKFFDKYPDAVLDGELFCNDLRQKLNELSSLIRKTKNITLEELKKSESLVRFFVYDGFNFGPNLGEDSPYEDRKNWIDANLPKFSKYFSSVETVEAFSLDEVNVIFGKKVADGQEGVIIRLRGMPYERKRSANLLKYKPFNTEDAVIVSLSEGTGNWAGTAKTATLKWKGKTFDATFKGSWEQGAERLRNQKLWIGKTIEFIFNDVTGLGIPNFARIDPDNCFK